MQSPHLTDFNAMTKIKGGQLSCYMDYKVKKIRSSKFTLGLIFFLSFL